MEAGPGHSAGTLSRRSPQGRSFPESRPQPPSPRAPPSLPGGKFLRHRLRPPPRAPGGYAPAGSAPGAAPRPPALGLHAALGAAGLWREAGNEKSGALPARRRAELSAARRSLPGVRPAPASRPRGGTAPPPPAPAPPAAGLPPPGPGPREIEEALVECLPCRRLAQGHPLRAGRRAAPCPPLPSGVPAPLLPPGGRAGSAGSALTGGRPGTCAPSPACRRWAGSGSLVPALSSASPVPSDTVPRVAAG